MAAVSWDGAAPRTPLQQLSLLPHTTTTLLLCVSLHLICLTILYNRTYGESVVWCLGIVSSSSLLLPRAPLLFSSVSLLHCVSYGRTCRGQYFLYGTCKFVDFLLTFPLFSFLKCYPFICIVVIICSWFIVIRLALP